MTRRRRLSAATLDELDPSVMQPGYDREAAGTGHVHLGIGAFARAHTAAYSDTAMAHGGGDWGIAAVSLRNPTVRDQLVPQDCLYTLVVSNADSTRRRLVSAIRSVHVAPEDPPAVVRLLADPAILIVTLTITEKGYCLAPGSGRLDFSQADVRHDIGVPDRPKTAIGMLVAAMQARRQSGAPPITVISCDNLPGNGRRLASALREFAGEVDPGLLAWIDEFVRFPATMVDRIVPATTPADLDDAEQAIGLRDEAMVKTEAFTQWVIEDDFANRRPEWETGGAIFVDDVEPYEKAKLRLLNGAHSALAYLGYLAGYDYVHEVVADPAYEAFARRLMTREISPVTPAPRGMEHATYTDALLKRFRNASLRHRTWQIAMDGSQKLPQRLLDTVREQLRLGGPIACLSLAVAAWMRYSLGRSEDGGAIDVQDPLSARFAAVANACGGNAKRIVAEYVGMTDVFGDDLAGNARFTSALESHLGSLFRQGVRSAVQGLADDDRR